jgi:hypothetical protein
VTAAVHCADTPTVTPGVGYLEALCEPHVETCPKGIKSFTTTGLEMEDGEKRDYDAISTWLAWLVARAHLRQSALLASMSHT